MEIILDSVIMILLGFFAHYTFNADYIPVVEIFIILIFSALNFILLLDLLFYLFLSLS